MEAVRSDDGLLREVQLEDADVTYPPRRNFRHGATTTQSWFTDPRGGCRTLQEFKKISIVEAKGYVYGWHFYQAGDADLVIASDDALFGHAAFRYAGAAPRMWWWAMSMGMRKFQEMVFTGRPFTADEMAECGFVNSVVPRDQLEAEVQKYALACAQNRPTDVIFMQKTFFEIMKQFQGEYMGSLVSGVLESMAGYGRPDAGELGTDDAIDQGLSQGGQGLRQPLPARVAAQQEGPGGHRSERAGPVTATPPLSDQVVVDLSTGIAGAYCTKLLADGGAEVVKVEPPEGDPLRGWSASGAEIPDGGRRRAVHVPLVVEAERGRRPRRRRRPRAACSALLAGPTRWCGRRGRRLAELPALAPEAIRRAAPHLTVTSITPVRPGGAVVRPRRHRVHPAGLVGRDRRSGSRLAGPGPGVRRRPDRRVAHRACTRRSARMASRAGPGVDGAGELVDVSMLETLALCLTYYPVTYVDMVGRPFRSGRSIVTPGVEATSDGLVGVGVGTGQQWLDFCVMVGHPEWMEDRSLFANRAHLQPEIAAWMAEHTTAEILELGRPVPHPARPRSATAPPSPPPTTSGPAGSIVREPAGRLRRTRPALPVRPAPAPHPGAGAAAGRARRHPTPVASRRPPTAAATRRRGRAAAATACGSSTSPRSGPARCARTCWRMLGAEVLHIESTARPDGTRLLSGLRFSEPDWWERSGIFCGLNTNKKSVTLDLATDRGRELLRRLIATCDVIVENYTPRVLEQMGLDFDAVRAIRPDVVMVRMPGFGLDGPWRDDPAFAFVIEDASGLTWMTGYPRPEPGLAVLRGRLERRHRTPCAGCSWRWSTAGAPVRASSSRRRWWTPPSTSPPSRSSSTRPTARCSGATATGDRPPPRRTSTSPPTPTPPAAATPGSRSRWRPTSSGWPCATRSVGPTWAMDPALATAAGRRRAPRRHRRPPVELVRRAQRRRDRRLPLGRRRARWPR